MEQVIDTNGTNGSSAPAEQPEYMALIKYNVNDVAIQELKDEYLPLKVCGFDDKHGYALCKEARKDVRAKRMAIEARRKELKRDVLDFGKAIDGEAKRLTAGVAEVESHLVEQINIIDEEKKRREEQAAKEAFERIGKMQMLLKEVDASYDIIEACRSYTDEQFEAVLDRETLRNAAAKAKAKAEAERLAKLEAERKEQEAELAKLRAEKAEAERKEQARLEAQRIEKEKVEAAKRAAEQAKLEAEQAAQHKENERLEAERKAKAKAEAAAKRQAADKQLFEQIKKEFPTIEKCWVEIVRLRKLTG